MALYEKETSEQNGKEKRAFNIENLLIIDNRETRIIKKFGVPSPPSLVRNGKNHRQLKIH
jgi:hypothetical protein